MRLDFGNLSAPVQARPTDLSHVSHYQKKPVGRRKPSVYAAVPHIPLVPPEKRLEQTDSQVGRVPDIDSEALAANDPVAPVADPDRWCWPHSPGWNSGEIETFAARVSRFTAKGVTLTQAQAVGDRLVIRDREEDERSLCLECSHLQGHGRWRCGNWQQAEVSREGIASSLVVMLQRCPGNQARRPVE